MNREFFKWERVFKNKNDEDIFLAQYSISEIVEWSINFPILIFRLRNKKSVKIMDWFMSNFQLYFNNGKIYFMLSITFPLQTFQTYFTYVILFLTAVY